MTSAASRTSPKNKNTQKIFIKTCFHHLSSSTLGSSARQRAPPATITSPFVPPRALASVVDGLRFVNYSFDLNKTLVLRR